jgi:hypothetical protein
MPVATTLNQLLLNLHEQKTINLDTPLRSLIDHNPIAQRLPTDIIIGPRYIYVTLLPDVARLNDVAGVADDVRGVAGQQKSPPPPRGGQGPVTDPSFGELSASGLLNLDAPLRALIQPDGAGAMEIDLRDAGPAIFIHQNYVFIHNPGDHPQLTEMAGVSEKVQAITGS